MCPCRVMPILLDNVYLSPSGQYQQAVENRVSGEKSEMDKLILADT